MLEKKLLLGKRCVSDGGEPEFCSIIHDW